MNKANRVLGVFLFSLLISSAGMFVSVQGTQAHGNGDGHAVGTVEGVSTVTNQSLRGDIARVNDELNSELTSYTTTKDKTVVLSKLLATAKSRKQKMLEQARTNPADFLNSVIPAVTYNKLPKEVQDQTEKALQVEGKLRVIHLDGINGKDLPNRYELTDSKTKKTYQIYFGTGEVPITKTGSVVKANGLYLDSSMVISNANSQSVGTGLTYLQSAPNTPSSTGPQSILAILVNLTDSAPTKPYTQADIQSAIFTGPKSANTYYKEVSYNQVSLTGDVTPWLSIPYSGADCSTATSGSGTSAALSAAAAAGYNLNNYSRYIFYMPLPNCSFAAGGASGNMIGIYTNDPINGNIFPHTTIHEIGHSLNINILGHSSTIDCGTKQIDTLTSCLISEYGDPTDVMGTSNFGMNGPHRVQLSWIPSSRIQTVTTGGIYTVSPLENPVGMQLLKIAKPDLNANYYIEYRQPIGIDSTLPTPYIEGAGIIVDPINIMNVGRINATPTDGVYDNLALADNLSFVDSINGITVKQLSHDSTGVTLQVTFASSVCKANPSVTASPLTQNGSAGQYLTYNVIVNNNDGPSCSGANFAIDVDSAGTQAGLKLDTATQTGVINPGASATIPVRVYPVIGSVGNLNFALTAKDVGDSTHTASSQQLTYNVVAGCGRSRPTINNLNPAQSGKRGDTVTYNSVITNSDSGNCPTSTFKVYGQGAPSWIFANPSDIQLAPGASATVHVSVTSPMDAVATTNLGIAVDDKNVIAHNMTSSVTYTITGLTCVPSPATITLANPNLAGSAGQTVNFDLKITNNDSIECESVPRVFDVVGLPSGFTIPYAAGGAVPPKTTFPATQPISSPANAVKGTYNFTIYLKDNITGTHITSVPASFTITGNPNCSTHQSTASVAPINQSGSKGQSLQYSVTVNNTDALDCADTLYSVNTSSLPTGFTSDSPTVKVAPGMAGTAVLTVTSPLSASSGNNAFTINVTGGNNSLHSTNLTANYNVSGTANCIRSKPTLTVTPTSQQGNPNENLVYNINITNNDLYSCSDATFNLAVAPNNFLSLGYVWTPAITLAPGGSGTTLLTVVEKTGTTGSNVFAVTSSDGSEPLHSASANATFVTKTAADCSRYAPSISLSPKSVTGVAGSVFDFTATVTNNDTQACPSSTFGVAAINMITAFTSSSNTKSMAPGTTTTFSLQISSLASTPNGTYNVDAKVADYNTLGHVTYDTATLIVSNGTVCTRNSPTISVSPVTQTGQAGQTLNYSVTTTNKDSVGCANSSFTTSASNLPSGFTANTVTTSSLAPGASGITTVSVTASSAASNSTNNFTITTTDTSVSGHSASTSSTYIINNPVICNRSTPTFAISPSSQTGVAGSSQSYTATVTNKDSSGCTSSTFSIQISGLPSGFTSNSSSVTLAPGASNTTTVSVTSPSSASNGTNSFTVSAIDNSVAGHITSTTASYVVNNPIVCNRAAPGITLSPTSQTGTAGQTLSYSATVYNNDSINCPSSMFNISTTLPSGFTSSLGSSSISLPGGNFKTITVNVTSPSGASNGSNSFTVNVSDTSIANHSTSGTTIYTVSNPIVCNRAAPYMTLSPSGNTGAAGSAQSYTATIYNNDGINCPSSTFNISTTLPAGFTSSLGSSSISLPGGNFKAVNVYITSPSTASNGSNTFTVNVSDTSIANHSTSASATYTVNNPVICNRAAPGITLSPTSQTGAAGSSQSYTATIYNNDGINCPSSTFNISTSLPSGFTSSISSTSITLPGGNFKTITVNIVSPANAVNGSNSFTVNITDNSIANHNTSGTSSYTVSNPVVLCLRAAPDMTLSPSGNTGVAGSAQSYTATIYNNDGINCPSSTFNISTSLPAGFTSSLGSSSISLPGGNFKAVNVYITSPSTASNGSNSFSVNVSDTSIANHSTSATATYTVNNPTVCKRSAPTMTLSPSYSSNIVGATTPFTVTVYNNDDNNCPSSTFNTSVTGLPNDFTTSISPASFTLPGGNFKVLNLLVASSTTTASNFYSFTVNTSDSSVTNHSASSDSSVYLYPSGYMGGRVRGDVTTVPNYGDLSQPHLLGTLIKIDNTYYIAGNGGLIGVPSIAVLQSWGYSLSQAVDGNSADRQQYQIKVLETKQPGQSHPWD